jgi:hypothetical protein
VDQQKLNHAGGSKQPYGRMVFAPARTFVKSNHVAVNVSIKLYGGARNSYKKRAPFQAPFSI